MIIAETFKLTLVSKKVSMLLWALGAISSVNSKIKLREIGLLPKKSKFSNSTLMRKWLSSS